MTTEMCEASSPSQAGPSINYVNMFYRPLAEAVQEIALFPKFCVTFTQYFHLIVWPTLNMFLDSINPRIDTMVSFFVI